MMARFASPVYAVLGPTCSGKTAVGMALAEKCGGEILSCDSMQVYRELNLGTAKPTAAERLRVPHHLIDILSIARRFDAGQFCEGATAAIQDIQARGAIPVLVGGSGLYAKALIYHLPLLPSDDEIFAAILRQGGSPEGLEGLAREAAERDPGAVVELRRNPRRLMRAVEVLRICGRLPQELRAETKPMQPDPAFRQFVLLPEPELHRDWIRQRAQTMLESGWVQEVMALRERGLFDTPTARQALGYRDIAEFLDRRGTELEKAAAREELLEGIATRTWQFARRQRTWFRHQHPGAVILSLDDSTAVDDLTEAILAQSDS